jgi:hypothetical protein
MDVQTIRKFALALPETVELEHFGNPSFRVRGRIVATVPDDTHLNVMIDPFNVDAVVRADPEFPRSSCGARKSEACGCRCPTLRRRWWKICSGAAWKRKASKRLST